MPEPTCCLRSESRFCLNSLRACEFNTSSNADFACSKLFCLDLHCAVAVCPVGIYVMRQEFWCLFLCWPPAPVPLYHSTLKSVSLCSILRNSGSVIATVTVLVCTLPLRSVGGTRCILCPPDSFSRSDRSDASTSIKVSPEISFIFRFSQPTRSKCRWYA